jgi:S-DNA-T family DNA segregation ATPase FtsK/SpoIIIE
MSKKTISDLSISCEHTVNSKYNEKIGAWFILERASGVYGIPSHVKFTNMLESFPASADGLTIPIGINDNSRMVYKSLGSMYSMLIAGTTGAGKSNFLNVIICTLIRRNKGSQVKFILVDLKGGVELGPFEKVPHLIKIPEICPTGIIEHREKVPPILEWLVREGERRLERFRETGVKNVANYNKNHHYDFMPHIILMIDEWADIKLDANGNKSEDLLTNCYRLE